MTPGNPSDQPGPLISLAAQNAAHDWAAGFHQLDLAAISQRLLDAIAKMFEEFQNEKVIIRLRVVHDLSLDGRSWEKFEEGEIRTEVRGAMMEQAVVFQRNRVGSVLPHV